MDGWMDGIRVRQRKREGKGRRKRRREKTQFAIVGGRVDRQLSERAGRPKRARKENKKESSQEKMNPPSLPLAEGSNSGSAETEKQRVRNDAGEGNFPHRRCTGYITVYMRPRAARGGHGCTTRYTVGRQYIQLTLRGCPVEIMVVVVVVVAVAACNDAMQVGFSWRKKKGGEGEGQQDTAAGSGWEGMGLRER